jgi:ADP-ribose pyrophosphatase YjhB (NUDIX family)
MTWQQVRPVALAVVRRGEEVLLARHYDPGEDYHFYRPVGGAIEFGEHSSEAVVREFAEELDVTLTGVEYLETFERTFTFDDNDGHEIWRLYEGDFEEDWPYEHDSFTAQEPELDEEFEAVWKHPEDFVEGGEIVYPDDLPELL